MGGQVDSVKMVIRRVPLNTNSKQLVPAGEYQTWEENHAGTVGLVHGFFAYAGFFCTKNSGTIRLSIKDGDAVGRGDHIAGGCHTSWIASERRHCPHLIEAGSSLVIDFFPVRREIVNFLAAFVICELQRLASRSKYQEHLRDTPYR